MNTEPRFKAIDWATITIVIVVIALVLAARAAGLS